MNLIYIFWCGIFDFNCFNCLTYFISLSIVVIFVKNMKYPSSVITMNLLQNFYTPLQIANYNLLSFLCWLGGKSSPPLLNYKVKVVKSCVKNNMDLKKCGSKVVGSRRFFLSCSSPRWEKITIGYQNYPLTGLNLRYMYFS